MLTPRYDDDPALLTSAVEDLAQCCLEVVEEMSWSTDDLLPLAKPVEVSIQYDDDDDVR